MPSDAQPGPAVKESSGPSTLLGSFRGLWTLLWKSRTSSRKVPALILVLLTIPVVTYFTVPLGGDRGYFNWVIDFYLLLLLPLYCLSTCGAMIRDEVQSDTLGFLITRPITRARLYLLQYASQMVWLEGIAFIHGVLLLAVGALREIPEVWSLAPIFLFAQFLAVLAYGALCSLLGLISQRYVVLGVIYGAVVEFGIGQIPTNIHTLALSHHVRTLLANNETVRAINDWSPVGTANSLMIMPIAALVFLALGAILFTLLEYQHSEEMQK